MFEKASIITVDRVIGLFFVLALHGLALWGVVTTLRSPSPQLLYQQEYCARGQAENLIKQVKVDLVRRVQRWPGRS